MSKRKWDETGPDSSSSLNGDKLSEAAAKAASIAKQLSSLPIPESSLLPPKIEAPHDVDNAAFSRDVDINDLRNRYVLTRASSQQKIHDDTGAYVTTRGQWYPDKSVATEKEPALFLKVTADTKEMLEKGVRAVHKLMEQELGPLVRDWKNEPRERRRWPEEKLIISLESLRNFNVRAKIVGPSGLFVKHIQQETGTRVQIKGLGSGFIEQETGRESDEPMHVCISGPDELMLAKAKELADDLLIVVREEHAKTIAFNQNYLQQQTQQSYAAYYSQFPEYAQYAQQMNAGQQPPMPDGSAPPMPPSDGAPPPPPGGNPAAGLNLPPGMGDTPEQQAYWAQIAANPEYASYFQQYYAYYQQAAAAGGQANPAQDANYGQQPPPPSGPAPPVPDARRVGSGRYGGVPPPPGL